MLRGSPRALDLSRNFCAQECRNRKEEESNDIAAEVCYDSEDEMGHFFDAVEREGPQDDDNEMTMRDCS